MRPSVVLCGSYHRDKTGLLRAFRELETTGCRVLSPLSIDFDNPQTDFVRAKSEQDFSVYEVEKFHLRAIRESKFVWLFAPDGYVGVSAAYEIGYASALHIPIFSKQLPEDEMIASQIIRVSSVFEALEAISLNAG